MSVAMHAHTHTSCCRNCSRSSIFLILETTELEAERSPPIVDRRLATSTLFRRRRVALSMVERSESRSMLVRFLIEFRGPLGEVKTGLMAPAELGFIAAGL